MNVVKNYILEQPFKEHKMQLPQYGIVFPSGMITTIITGSEKEIQNIIISAYFRLGKPFKSAFIDALKAMGQKYYTMDIVIYTLESGSDEKRII